VGRFDFGDLDTNNLRLGELGKAEELDFIRLFIGLILESFQKNIIRVKPFKK